MAIYTIKPPSGGSGMGGNPYGGQTTRPPSYTKPGFGNPGDPPQIGPPAITDGASWSGANGARPGGPPKIGPPQTQPPPMIGPPQTDPFAARRSQVASNPIFQAFPSLAPSWARGPSPQAQQWNSLNQFYRSAGMNTPASGAPDVGAPAVQPMPPQPSESALANSLAFLFQQSAEDAARQRQTAAMDAFRAGRGRNYG